MILETGYILNNRYRIVRLLGQGGFGAVYRAWDIHLNRACAVKENLNTSLSAQRQFNREASLLANLSHPGLPRVTDHFIIHDQGQYLVMDYIEGDDLQTMLDAKGRPLSEIQVVNWMAQICDALNYLHLQNPSIIHRDIKPANIKITPDGRAVLVDFGIAKIFDAHQETTMGARAVTPGYSPMEQYGQGKTDARSDIYALGATLYTLLTGQQPVESVQRTLGAQLATPRSLNRTISDHIEQAVLRAMAIHPDHRFLNILDFKSALTRRMISQPVVQVEPRRVMQPVHRPASQRTSAIPTFLIVSIASGIVVVLIIFAVVIGGWNVLGKSNRSATDTAMSFAEAVKGTIFANKTPSHTTAVSTTEIMPPTDIRETATQLPTLSFTPTVRHTPFSSPTPTPQLEAAIVEPYCSMFNQSPRRTKQHQPVILWWRWDALTAQLVKDHIEAAIYEIILDGEHVNADRMSEIEYLGDKKFYRVSWYADIGVLSPGSHRAERQLSWTHKISDGWTTYGPGGKIETEYHYCDIIVQ